jgi:DNA-binding transcriptional LysR family regulator
MAGLAGLVAFAEVAKQGGFAKAARTLGQSASGVAKSVARLERELGVRLFQRTTRKVALTGDGRAFHARCRRIVEEIEALRADAEGVRREPRGTLSLTAPLTYGKAVIVPALARLLVRHPALRVELALSDRRVDLVGEGLDAAVRIGALEDSTLVARRIGRQQLVVLASPAYLKRRGAPATPADLLEHACLAFRLPATGRLRPWEFRDAGRALRLEPPARLVLDEGEALARAAAHGLGLIQAPSYMAEAELATGRLREVLARFRPPPMPISLVYAAHREMTPRLRALVEALVGRSGDAVKNRS